MLKNDNRTLSYVLEKANKRKPEFASVSLEHQDKPRAFPASG